MGNEVQSDFSDKIGDPSFEAIFKTSRNIVIVGLCIILVMAILNIAAVVDQIQTRNWEKVSGTVTNAEWDWDTGSADDNSDPPTVVTVAYTYLGENYTTSTYSFVSSGWGEDPEHWQAIESVDIYVNPDNPSEAVCMAGWAVIMEEVAQGLSFLGLILGLYLVIVVPAWIIYAKVRRDKD